MISTVPWWLVIEIFARDVVILASSGTLLLLDRRRRFPPSVWGKASTFLQIACALAILVNNAFPGAVTGGWQDALFATGGGDDRIQRNPLPVAWGHQFALRRTQCAHCFGAQRVDLTPTIVLPRMP